MRSTRAILSVLVPALGAAAAACGQSSVRMPSEFEIPGSELGRLFSYFGGVASYSTAIDPVTIHTGYSCRVDINFRHDNFFRRAGVGVGTLGIVPPVLAVPPGADTFSMTIQLPEPVPAGALSIFASIREDDNADGVIDPMTGDDQWETVPLFIMPGTHVYNIPISAMIDSNEGVGNDTRDFTTTPRMAFFFTIETSQTYPGGIIESPVSLRIDHAGFYAGPQSIPAAAGACCVAGECQQLTQSQCTALAGEWRGAGTPCDPAACAPVCLADFNRDAMVNSQDFFDFLGAFFALAPAADINADAAVNSQDFFDFVSALFAGC
ncbi:MAG: GC-type dockerin domain-anchored protein [Phycisphaerales bacterium]